MQPAHSSPPRSPPIVQPTVAFGFGIAVVTWAAWLVTHLPFAEGGGPWLPASVRGITIVAAMLAGSIAAGVSTGPRRALRVGAGAGLVSALVNLLILGSYLPDAGGGGLVPAAALWIPGFVVLSVLVGLIGAACGGMFAREAKGPTAAQAVAEVEAASPTFWISRLSLFTVVALGLLIILGGAVTSTESGLAVPDWPGTYGANMVLYPVSLMTGRIFVEHSHRLFGLLAGVSVLTLAGFVLVKDRANRRSVVWALILVAFVVVQGVLGGLRVTERSVGLAIVHGVLAQATLAVAVTVAVGLSPLYRGSLNVGIDPKDRRRKLLATGTLHSLLLQLLLGASFRHLHAEGSRGSMHALWTHVGFSIVVLTLALLAGFLLLWRHGGSDAVNKILRRTGLGILACVCFQFALGWVVLAVVLMAPKGTLPTAEEVESARQVPPLEWVTTMLHHANGALLLSLATVAVVWTRRILRARTLSEISES